MLLHVESVSKRFGPVQALQDVTVPFAAGHVHALLGENGAGKSTLTKIIGGAFPPDSGSLIFRGKPARFSSPAAALAAGISVIYQELSLIPDLTVSANVFLGYELRTVRGTLDERRMRDETNSLLALLGAEYDADARVEDLSVADQQLAEIARALNHKSSLFIMDEPTASLPNESAQHLFEVIRRLTKRGACVVYISHELEEVFEIADRLTVLKDGQLVMTCGVSETTSDAVIRAMVGRTLGEMFPPRSLRREGGGSGRAALEIRDLSLPGYFEAISFDIWPGEILGMAGLIGSGRSAVARTIFGSPPGVGGPGAVRGTVRVHGQELRPVSPRDAIAVGIGYVPEERKIDGLALEMSIADNIALPQLSAVSRFGVVRLDREVALADEQIRALSIRTSSARIPVGNLSGGNQQKVVLSKWLACGSKVLILDDPTRGIDVGAKMEIYRLIRELADGGAAILLISSDLPEVLGLSDRLLVLRKGKIVMRLDHMQVSEEEVIRAALGAEDNRNGQCA